MKILDIGLRVREIASLSFLLLFAWMIQTTSASSIGIYFTGLDITYDGLTVADTGAPSDDLMTMTFLIDGAPAVPAPGNTLLADIHADLSIDLSATAIPAGGGDAIGHGSLELSIPGFGIDLDLPDVTVTYLPLGFVNFVFAGSLASIDAQVLPFGLTMGEPVTVSFSTQVSAISANDTIVNSFTAAGTGEVRGELVPEPSSLLLLLPCLFGLWARGVKK